MQVRSSRTLVFTIDEAEDALVGINFLTKDVFGCPADLIARLPKQWMDAEELAQRSFTGDLSAVQSLIENNAVVVAGSDLEKRESQYLDDWHWSLPIGLMHYCLEDLDFMTVEETEETQREHLLFEAQPPLYLRNRGAATPLPAALGNNDLIDLMARRRTVRVAGAPTISLNNLSDCLFAGLGITGETVNCVGTLPLGMTPSGGARNPYEAYVFARRVEGLDPGVYHYSAIDHDLGRLSANELPAFSELVGGQDWADEMPAMVVLVADLRRTMWKYSDPNAYRVVLIEAGHIGQNIMLAATRHGLSACPTAALNHSTIKRIIGQDHMTDAPIYALTLAIPGVEKTMPTRNSH
jgi:SagB-type dehydrogenase family enzyme